MKNNLKSPTRGLLLRRYMLWNAALTLTAALWVALLLWIPALRKMPCLTHNLLHLYCPFCGGTRAVLAILSLDFAGAWHYYPPLYILLLLVILYEIAGLVSVIRVRSPLISVPRWLPWTLLAVWLVFFIVRNLLMILWGIDPVGDLAPFWNAIKNPAA